MKFLCDRCKTRYSIGDDRVRGKILKIRCKSCGHVITVREGMVQDLDGPTEPARGKKPTTGAPPSMNEAAEAAARGSAKPAAKGASAGKDASGKQAAARRPAAADNVARDEAVGRRFGDARRSEAGHAPAASPVNALGAAFASAMAKPPPALEEEWYVSIDGEQEGPFSLAVAQQWVAQKPFEAELHCWSEGFDDWLPVDKVSHFRGLRKKPAPAAPPPLPRLASVPRGADPVVQGAGKTAARAPVSVAAPVDDEPKPLFAATMAQLERSAPALSSPAIALPPPATPARATPPQGIAVASRANGVQARPAAAATPARGKLAQPFDVEIEAPTEIAPIPYPVAAAQAEPALAVRDASSPSSEPDRAAAKAPAHDDDHELAIGEVSRVVNLADIVRPPRAAERASTAAGVGRRTGVSPAFRSSGALPSMPPAADTPEAAAAADAEHALAMAPVHKHHRRGLIALLSVAGVMVLGVVGAVILLVTNEEDSGGGKLGPVHDFDTLRPEDPITHRPLDPQNPATRPGNPLVPRIAPHPRIATGTAEPNHDPESPPGNSLSADEVEDVARKHQDITQRCYMRSQRGADSILVGDVKKIAVTMTIDTDGNVNDIKLSEHGADNLGKCLTGTIKGWRFRPSSGGTFRFSLNFVGG